SPRSLSDGASTDARTPDGTPGAAPPVTATVFTVRPVARKMPSTVLPPATAAAQASLPCALSAGIGCLPKPEKVPPAGEGSPSTTTLATFPSDHTKKPSLARPRRIVAKKATRPSEVTGATIGRDSTLKRSNVPPPGTASPASTTGRVRSAAPAAEDRAANGATSAA